MEQPSARELFTANNCTLVLFWSRCLMCPQRSSKAPAVDKQHDYVSAMCDIPPGWDVTMAHLQYCEIYLWPSHPSLCTTPPFSYQAPILATDNSATSLFIEFFSCSRPPLEKFKACGCCMWHGTYLGLGSMWLTVFALLQTPFSLSIYLDQIWRSQATYESLPFWPADVSMG